MENSDSAVFVKVAKDVIVIVAAARALVGSSSFVNELRVIRKERIDFAYL